MSRRRPRGTVPKTRPPKRQAIPRPPRVDRPQPPRGLDRPPPRGVHARPPRARVAHIIDEGEKSLVDVLDSLLNQGVVLNADLVLALADVDLVYVRLSALLCAADRVLPPGDR